MLNKPKCSNCSIDLKLGPLSDLPQKKIQNYRDENIK